MRKTTAALSAAIAIVSAAAAVKAVMPAGHEAKLPVTDTPFVIIPATEKGNDDDVVKLPERTPSRAKAMDVPFVEDFSSPSTLGDWGIQDVNNDGNSWEYKESFGLVRCYGPTTQAFNDDWLVTPGINLGKDDIYTLTFSFGSQGSRYAPDKLTVTMGTSPYATQHTTQLFSRDDIQNFWNGSMETVTITLPVEADGTYYFGFHCGSPSASYCLYLDDVKVEQNGSYAAPDMVGGFDVTPGINGAREAVIKLTAPEQTVEGGSLNAIDNIIVSRDGQAVHTFDSPAPGAALSFTDTQVPDGMHTYTAVATAGGLDSPKAEMTVYVGVDAPMSVTSVKAEENPDCVVLTWAAPEGVHGGYVGNDVVSYRVTRFDGNGDEVVLDDELKTTTYTDYDLDFSVQNHVYYTIEAGTVSGVSDPVSSNSLLVGPAYPVPFREDFKYCGLATSPWVMEYIETGFFNTNWRTTAMGANPYCPPIDGDDGMLEFVTSLGGYNFYAGNVVRLATPAVDLSETTNPYVSFYLFHYDSTTYSQEYDEETEEYVTITNSYNDKLHLQVALDNGEYTDVPDSEILVARNNTGWNLYTFSLSAYKASKVSVALVGTADGGANICVDHLTITDSFEHDLAITGLLGAAQVNVGETAGYIANIVNNGTSSTKNYTVDLYVDGVKVDSQKGPGAAIFANGGEKTVRLSLTPGHNLAGGDHKLYAVINYGEDECLANNTSEVITLTVPDNGLPKVENLAGNITDNAVTLTWDEPDMSGVRLPVNDTMEGYTPFAISGVGNYTLVDNDKAATYTVSGISDYPNAGSAMAWQVFDPAAAGIDNELDFNRRWVCHSGNQCLVSWGADVSSGVTANDDWLISPELSGESQRVSFYIKSVTLAYPERFRVLYSTDSKSTSDFVKIAEANYYSPMSYWRKFSVILPEGAKYFAIHCISADAFGLMVDDITFTPATSPELQLEFLGYNVYRDGVKINAAPLGEPEFTDTPDGSASHDYYVTALYPEGESAPSPVFAVGKSGITAPVTDRAEGVFKAVGHTGCLEVDGCSGLVEVFGVDGRLAVAEKVEGNLTFSIAPGTYIVRYGAKVVKTVVR